MFFAWLPVDIPAAQEPCMQEPAACGALPAQQDSVHSGPLAAAGQAMLPATRASSIVTARIALAATIALIAKALV